MERLRIEAPWLVENSGSRRRDRVRWELGAAGERTTPRLTLVVQGEGLSYPLLVDPTWTAAGSMAVARAKHTATTLADGKVLVVGGIDTGGKALSSAELYDPAANTWTAAGSLPSGHFHFDHTSTLLPNGKVLVAGGTSGSSLLVNALLYDPAANTWRAAAPMTTGRTITR